MLFYTSEYDLNLLGQVLSNGLFQVVCQVFFKLLKTNLQCVPQVCVVSLCFKSLVQVGVYMQYIHAFTIRVGLS